MITPRNYLSWSSMDLLERSESKWIAQYLMGKEPPKSRAMDLGTKLADALEEDEFTGDLMTDIIVAKMPKLAIRDQIITANLNRGRGVEPIPLLAKPDTRNEDFSAFREYKSGSVPWNKRRVDECGQITFYATVGYIIRGEEGRKPQLVEDIHLDWAPTKKEDPSDPHSKIIFTGEVIPFRTQRTMADVLRMMLRMRKAWEKIQLLTERELF